MSTTSTIRNAAALGAIVLQARTARGLTQRQLAASVGASLQQISDLEAGRSTKAVERLFLILRELDLELHAAPTAKSIAPGQASGHD